MSRGLEKFLYLPARMSIYSNTSFLHDPIIQGFKYGVGRAYQTPISEDWINARSVLANVASLYMQGKITTDASAVLRLKNSILSPVTFSYPVINPVPMPESFTITGDAHQWTTTSSNIDGMTIYPLILACIFLGVIYRKKPIH